jgi:DNA-directed RNA polymerase specialized sigma24 family protein
MNLNEITPENLDSVAKKWEEDRLEVLVRENVMTLGDDYRQAKRVLAELEIRCKIRAIKLKEQHGFADKEIAELFGLTVRKVRSWLK